MIKLLLLPIRLVLLPLKLFRSAMTFFSCILPLVIVAGIAALAAWFFFIR